MTGHLPPAIDQQRMTASGGSHRRRAHRPRTGSRPESCKVAWSSAAIRAGHRRSAWKPPCTLDRGRASLWQPAV